MTHNTSVHDVMESESGPACDTTQIAGQSFPSPSNKCAVDSILRASQSNPSQSGTPFFRAFTILMSAFGDHVQHPLKDETIIEIMKLSDSFLREDARSFLESFRLGWSQNGLWDRPPLTNPTSGEAAIEKLFNSSCCAEVLEQDSVLDPFRLRIARILLYHYYKQLCISSLSNPDLLSRRSRGRDTASIVMDKILEDIYHSEKDRIDSRTWKRRRASLHKHKQIGKRWCMVATHLGLGILIACHPSFEAQM